MARVTVEDCLDKVENRFELVMLGTKRARQLAVDGKEAFVEIENDKPTVVALREIAEGHINAQLLSQVEQEEFEDIELDEDMLTELTAESAADVEASPADSSVEIASAADESQVEAADLSDVPKETEA